METLGCPKNQVDSDKLTWTLLADGLVAADAPETADLVVVNTCAFIEEARQESIDTILGLSERQSRDGAELVVTGCMAERYGGELAEALPEADVVVGFGVPVHLGPTRSKAQPIRASNCRLTVPTRFSRFPLRRVTPRWLSCRQMSRSTTLSSATAAYGKSPKPVAVIGWSLNRWLARCRPIWSC